MSEPTTVGLRPLEASDTNAQLEPKLVSISSQQHPEHQQQSVLSPGHSVFDQASCTAVVSRRNSASPSSAGSSSFSVFMSHVRKMPRTLKNLLARSTGSDSGPEGITKSSMLFRKKFRVKPEDLFESDISYEDEEDDLFRYNLNATLTGATAPTPKQYSTNVDMKEYNLPIGSERKRLYNNSKHVPPTRPTDSVVPTGLENNNNLDKSTTGCLAFIYGHTVHGADITKAFPPAGGRDSPPFSSSDLKKDKSPQLQTQPKMSTDILPAQLPHTVTPHINIAKISTFEPVRTLGSTHEIESPSEDSSDSESDEEERINPGYKEWKKRRKAWTKRSSGSTQGQSKPSQESAIKHMSESEKVTIYKHLVLNNRRLRKPVPLADALVVLKTGWVATGQWPARAP